MIEICKLNKKYNKAKFDCENHELNSYLHSRASQDTKSQIANCFCAIDENDNVIGYYTLSAASLELDKLSFDQSKKLPKYKEIGCALLGRLGIDKNHKNKGYGKILIIDAMKKSFASDIKAWALIVDAKNDDIAKYYINLGFIPLEDNHLRLYITRPKDWK